MLSLGILFIAIACLSLSMNKHFKAVFNKALSQKNSKILKISGWSLLVMSFLLVEPASVNYVNWFVFLSIFIVLQAWLMTKIKFNQT